MATRKYRLNRKNSSGSYDVIHYETSSDIVMRSSGVSAEEAFRLYDILQGMSNLSTRFSGGEIVQESDDFVCVTSFPVPTKVVQVLTYRSKTYTKEIIFGESEITESFL